MLEPTDDTTQADEALLTALIADLDAGFASLVRAYERMLYSVALRVSGDPAEAEDLTAESLLRAYRSLRTFPEDRLRALCPRSWLLTILMNHWRNTTRAAHRKPPPTSLEALPDQPSRALPVETTVENAETTRELRTLLTHLPPRQREAVVLRHVIGLPMTEVAAVMKVPEGTAKSHTSRGLSRLRDLYTPPHTTPLRKEPR